MIEVQNLGKKFRERTVLNDVSFQVKEGEIFGYLGPNGAGKTTTMRIMLGIPKSKPIATSIAIGYPNLEAPINHFPRPREPLDAIAHWHGL